MPTRSEGEQPDGLRGIAHEAMGFDPAHVSEELTGLSYDDPEAVGVAFQLFQANERTKRAALGELNDTHFGVSWQNFEEIATGAGFEIISRRRFDVPAYPGKSRTDHPEILVAAHKDKKLLLVATSHMSSPTEEVLNAARVYGTVDVGRMSPGAYVKFVFNPQGVGGSWRRDGRTAGFYLNALEGMLSKIQMLEDQGFTFIDWHDPNRFLYMLTHEDELLHSAGSQGSHELYEQRVQEFFASAPQWVRDFIL